jgi:hypothetical protein
MASNPATSSDLLAADTAVMTRAGRLLGVQLQGDGTNACNVVLYDNASAASGKVLCQLFLIASNARFVDATLPPEGIVCNNGIYADVTGTGAKFIVYYCQE